MWPNQSGGIRCALMESETVTANDLAEEESLVPPVVDGLTILPRPTLIFPGSYSLNIYVHYVVCINVTTLLVLLLK